MKFIRTALVIALITSGVLACFDTYLFLAERPMVYPAKTLAFDGFGEYSVNESKNPAEDEFLISFNAFYGIDGRLSLLLGGGSSEKGRGEFAFDEIWLGATYNLLSRKDGAYTLDAMAACVNNFDEKELALEISAPNIFHSRGLTLVAHPVMEVIPSEGDVSFGAHFGLFKSLDKRAVFGIGAEYMSAQSGPVFGNRIVEGETAMSLFFGAMIGKNFYIQNEFAKGLANSRDFGFATTLKFLIDMR
ncbi:MAG TPA: hypothetical protein ENN07_06935 [candidate division Zixibacteria bacterium]|nr:hypothetical protein [candidate division Zixibacteria bacterium]